MIKKYRKKPVTIEAIRWNGENLSEIDEFTEGKVNNHESVLIIPTLEGDMYASLNDYIIKGVNGEFYPCKPYIFAKTYDEVMSSPIKQSYDRRAIRAATPSCCFCKAERREEGRPIDERLGTRIYCRNDAARER